MKSFFWNTGSMYYKCVYSSDTKMLNFFARTTVRGKYEKFYPSKTELEAMIRSFMGRFSLADEKAENEQ